MYRSNLCIMMHMNKTLIISIVGLLFCYLLYCCVFHRVIIHPAFYLQDHMSQSHDWLHKTQFKRLGFTFLAVLLLVCSLC